MLLIAPEVQTREQRELHIHLFMALSHEYAQERDLSNCWVCAHVPLHSKGSIPLRPMPFNESEMAEWIISQNDTHVNTSQKRHTSYEGTTSTEDWRPEWESAGYNLTAFQGWYQPKYNWTRQPPFLVLTNTSGIGAPVGKICLVRNIAGGENVGKSKCGQNSDSGSLKSYGPRLSPSQGRRDMHF